MTRSDFPIFDDQMRLVNGAVACEGVPVYAVVRNEMFFLPAFLEHYRQLGARQFFFLDDRSDDGTFEYLSAQPDCVVARSGRRFGEQLGGRRTDVVWKSQIPHQYMPGRWAVCADADEFLVLPPGFRTLDEFVAALDRRGTSAVPGVMVDFYPETLAELERLGVPSGRDELFASYPWFDAGPYFRWEPGEPLPTAPFGGVRERLLRKFRISRRKKPKSLFKRLKNALRGGGPYGPWVAKVPLVKWEGDRFYRNSHSLNIAPDTGLLLPIAHFKLTSDLHNRIESAITSRAHAKGSQEYFELVDLVMRLKAGDGVLRDRCSVRFARAEDFAENGLMRFDGVRPPDEGA